MLERSRKKRGPKLLKPAAWHFDRRLFQDLKAFWLEASFEEQIDARDWMTAEPLSMVAGPGETEFWFDYLADTGDSGRATHSIAWLALSDLSAPTQRGPFTRFRQTGPEAREILPRGRLLIIGGDTAYNVADAPTLRERFHRPFERAAKEHALPAEPAWLLGVPGNHDYYDALDGFNRMFREPLQGDGDPGHPPPFSIPGFVRKQSASYFAVDLPFGWRLSGIDCELGHVDRRQKKFFDDLPRAQKNIIATPEPAVVLGPGRPGEKTRKAMHDLGFLQPAEASRELPPGECRLDLSGDTHRFERHFGGPHADGAPARYASVVSGGGGASHQPVHGQITPATAKLPHFPRPEDAGRAATTALVNPWTMASRTFAAIVGALLALAVQRSYEVLTPPAGDGVWAKALGDPGFWRGAGAIVTLACWVGAIVLLAVGRKGVKSGLLRMALADVLCLAATWSFPAAHSTRVLRALGSSLAVIAALFTIRWALARSSRADRGLPRSLLTLVGLFALWWAMDRIGDVSRASDLLFDSLSLSFALLIAGTLFAVGPFVEAKGASAGLKVTCGILGAHHVVVQLGLPLVLVLHGKLASAFGVALVMLVTAVIATKLPAGKPSFRWWLAATWLLQSVASFAVVFAAHGPLSPPGLWPQPSSLAAMFAAAGAGAVIACVGAGWFFATAVAFGAFAEAVGGIAGIDRFQHFLRIRLRENDLTVFAIGFDQPREEGKEWELVFVDEFTLTPKG